MTRGTEFRVGVLVIVAIIATTAWLFILKESKFKTPTYPLYVSYTRVAGIKSGADVTIRGVSKGKVADVQLDRERVRLLLEIEKGTFIAEDARFVLHVDLINPTSIRIEQGKSDTPLAPGSELVGMEMVGIGAVLEGGSSLISSLQVLAERADSLTASGRMDRLVTGLEEVSLGFKEWTEEGRRATNQALARIESLAGTLEALLDENRAPLNQALEGVGTFTVRADSLASDLTALTASLSSISQRLESGEGSLGKALADEELYDRLSQAVARLDSLTKDIQENPKRYFHFSIF